MPILTCLNNNIYIMYLLRLNTYMHKYIKLFMPFSFRGCYSQLFSRHLIHFKGPINQLFNSPGTPQCSYATLSVQRFVRVGIAALCDLLSVVECGGSQGGCILIITFNSVNSVSFFFFFWWNSDICSCLYYTSCTTVV